MGVTLSFTFPTEREAVAFSQGEPVASPHLPSLTIKVMELNGTVIARCGCIVTVLGAIYIAPTNPPQISSRATEGST